MLQEVNRIAVGEGWLISYAIGPNSIPTIAILIDASGNPISMVKL